MSSSPYINRFLSADTIVPGYANPQNLNRYSYVTNNPLRYTDPTGHMIDDGCKDYGCGGSYQPLPPLPPIGSNTGGTPPVPNVPLVSNIPLAPTGTPVSPFVPFSLTSTPVPPAALPTFCPTPYPGQMPCWTDPNRQGPPPPYYPFGWNSSAVPWDEVALDAGGLLGDVIPLLQVPATVAEGAHNVDHVLNITEIYLNAWQIVDSGGVEQIDGFNLLLDFASFVPEAGAVPSAIGLVYNLQKGIIINGYP